MNAASSDTDTISAPACSASEPSPEASRRVSERIVPLTWDSIAPPRSRSRITAPTSAHPHASSVHLFSRISVITATMPAHRPSTAKNVWGISSAPSMVSAIDVPKSSAVSAQTSRSASLLNRCFMMSCLSSGEARPRDQSLRFGLFAVSAAFQSTSRAEAHCYAVWYNFIHSTSSVETHLLCGVGRKSALREVFSRRLSFGEPHFCLAVQYVDHRAFRESSRGAFLRKAASRTFPLSLPGRPGWRAGRAAPGTRRTRRRPGRP